MFVLGGEASFPAEHFEGGEKRTEAGVFAAAAREAGIKFGIRVNLESISENGELYEKHPEYAMKIPGREPLRVKGRLLLNFADPRVQKYAVRALSSLLSETKASYVYWETGGRMADCFCRDVPAGEYFLRYTEGLYAVLGRIAEKFPGVLFEGGAGGGRFDLGLLCYFPQIAAEGGGRAARSFSPQRRFLRLSSKRPLLSRPLRLRVFEPSDGFLCGVRLADRGSGFFRAFAVAGRRNKKADRLL